MATLGNFSGETGFYFAFVLFLWESESMIRFLQPGGNFAGIMREGRREWKFEMIFYYRDSYVSAGIETPRRGVPYRERR